VTDRPEPERRPDAPRRYPSTLGGTFYILEALVAAAGLAVIALGPWRVGLRIMGGALIGGAVARLLLADELSGMLKVRRKSLDVLFMTVLGVGLIVLSIAVPEQA
jgi:Protein of unknown function (DUF3017)